MRKLLSAITSLLSVLLIPITRVWAQDTGDVATFKDLETIFGNVIRALVELTGVVLFVMLLVGGFKFLFSGGDKKQLESAKGTVTNAIVGLVVIVVAYLILKTIDVFVFGGAGVITKFEIPTQ